MSASADIDARAELLAEAGRDDLIALADRITATGTWSVVNQPTVGMVVLQVREPVAAERFHLAEVLVTEAAVDVDGAPGWAMRTGDDRLATLAAAVCDAAVESDHPLAGEVAVLCAATADRIEHDRAAERAAVAPTTVQFAELDR